MNQNSLARIRKLGYSNEEIHKATHISKQTIEKQLSRKSVPLRFTVPEAKLKAFCFVVEEMSKQFSGITLKREVQQLRIGNRSLSDFLEKIVNPKAEPELLETAMRYGIESRLKETTNERAETLFRKKYEYLNPETLQIASIESPDLVEGILGDEKSDPLVRSFALMALAHTGNEHYVSVLKIYAHSDAPLIRESAFVGLYEFYDLQENKNLELKAFFKERLITERAPGVQARIKSILEQM
jgi:hypothetical protein